MEREVVECFPRRVEDCPRIATVLLRVLAGRRPMSPLISQELTLSAQPLGLGRFEIRRGPHLWVVLTPWAVWHRNLALSGLGARLPPLCS